MRFNKIDLQKSKRITYKSTLGVSGSFKITVYWNEVSQVWLMDLAKADDTPIFYGQTLIQNIDLLRPHRNLGTPIGVMVVGDNGNETTVLRAITYDNISDFSLYFSGE